jgi:hypothetical protein
MIDEDQRVARERMEEARLEAERRHKQMEHFEQKRVCLPTLL